MQGFRLFPVKKSVCYQLLKMVYSVFLDELATMKRVSERMCLECLESPLPRCLLNWYLVDEIPLNFQSKVIRMQNIAFLLFSLLLSSSKAMVHLKQIKDSAGE